MKWQILHTKLFIENHGTLGIAVRIPIFYFRFFTISHYFFLPFFVGSFFTANLKDGLRPSQTAIEDMFIRKFIEGTFPGILISEVIIKRQFNHIRIAFLLKRRIRAQKIYFLIGYSEEMLANWLQCPITLEMQSIEKIEDAIFKYI